MQDTRYTKSLIGKRRMFLRSYVHAVVPVDIVELASLENREKFLVYTFTQAICTADVRKKKSYTCMIFVEVGCGIDYIA